MTRKKNEHPLKKYSLEEHLLELKRRVLIVILFFVVCVVLSFQLSWKIFDLLASPLMKILGNVESFHFIYTKLTEGLIVELKIAFIMSIFLTSPILFIQTYKFLEPGLYEEEKKTVLRYMFFPPLLFLLGMMVVYLIVIPVTWKFFINFRDITTTSNSVPIVLKAKISEYIELVLELFIGFGLAFQLPMIILVLAKFGFVCCNQLKSFRRYAIVLIFILSAVLTPPDILSQLILALPLILLYEISILFCHFTQNQKHRP